MFRCVGGAVGVVRDDRGGVPKWDELLKCKCDIDATLQELMDNRLVHRFTSLCAFGFDKTESVL